MVSGAVCGLGLGAALSAVFARFDRLSAHFDAVPALGLLGGRLRRQYDLRCVCRSPISSNAASTASRRRRPPLHCRWHIPRPRLPGALSTESSSLLWDLVGAALGILYVVPALEWLGGVGALLGASVFAMAAVAFFLDRWVWACPIILTTGLVVYSTQQRELIDLSALAEDGDKPMFRALARNAIKGEVKATRWSAYARTDLGRSHGRHGPELVCRWRGWLVHVSLSGDYRRLFFVRREAAFFPYYFSRRERALIIGPGGGADVLLRADDWLAAYRSCRDQSGDRRTGALLWRVQWAICTTWRAWSCTSAMAATIWSVPAHTTI